MRNGVETRSLAGQVIDAVGDPSEPVLQGKPIEQARAEEGGVGIEDQGRERSDTAARSSCRPIAVGPGDILGKPGRPAAARNELAEPDRRLLALAAEADQLDFVLRAGEVLREIAGRAELDGPGGDSPRGRIPESGPGSVIIERSSALVTGVARRSGSRCSQAPAGIAKASARARTGRMRSATS